MPIFRYTFKKCLIAKSTLIITILTAAALLLGWSIIFILINSISKDSKIKDNYAWKLLTTNDILYIFLSTWKTYAFVAVITLMLLIFVAFKATQIFRDEIDDGTLLILVSKPVTRNRIWFEKWLAFQAIIVFFLITTIFLPSFLVLIPFFGGPKVFLALLLFLPFLFIVAILFQLLYSSCSLLLSFFTSSKATIAITFGFAALFNVVNNLDSSIFSSKNLANSYMSSSQAVYAYKTLGKRLSKNDFDKLNELQEVYRKDKSGYNSKNDKLNNALKDLSDSSPIKEKEILISQFKNPNQYTGLKDYNVLISQVVPAMNIYWQLWSVDFLQIFCGKTQETDFGIGFYTIKDMFEELKNLRDKTWSQEEINSINSTLRNKRIFRSFNIFYQLSYLYNNSLFSKNTVFTSYWITYDDPLLLNFEQKQGDKFSVDIAASNAKLISYPALISVYSILTLASTVMSWFVFQRRDFA